MAQLCAREFLSTNVTQYNHQDYQRCHPHSIHLLLIIIISITIIMTMIIMIIIKIVIVIITVLFLRMIICRDRKAEQNCKPAETFDDDDDDDYVDDDDDNDDDKGKHIITSY